MTSLYITESGSFIKRRGGHVVIGRNNETLMEVPLERVEDVSVIDSVQISSELITEFFKTRCSCYLVIRVWTLLRYVDKYANDRYCKATKTI